MYAMYLCIHNMLQAQIILSLMDNALHFNIYLEDGYHLPPTYYKALPTPFTVCTVLILWMIIPILSYNPDLLDPVLPDYFEAIADWQKTNVIKIFNLVLWVSEVTNYSYTKHQLQAANTKRFYY